MDKQPLVTILTDTKNRAGLISRCIESIQKQTYQNYEHIIADGGSDNTEEVVMVYNDPLWNANCYFYGLRKRRLVA